MLRMIRPSMIGTEGWFASDLFPYGKTVDALQNESHLPCLIRKNSEWKRNIAEGKLYVHFSASNGYMRPNEPSEKYDVVPRSTASRAMKISTGCIRVADQGV